MSIRKTKRIFLKQLSRIYDRSKSIADQFGEDKIPVLMFKKVIDTSKLRVTNEPNLKPLVDQFNKTLDTMHQLAKDTAKSLDNKSIKLVFVKQMVDKTKESFKEGVKNG